MFSQLLASAMLLTTAYFGSHELDRPEVTRQIPVNETFFENDIAWTDGPPSYVYRMRLIIVEGVVEVCGAGAYHAAQALQSETRIVLKNSAVFINNEPYLTDLTFFTKVARPGQLMGSEANCVSTNKRAPEAADVHISIRNVGKRSFTIR